MGTYLLLGFLSVGLAFLSVSLLVDEALSQLPRRFDAAASAQGSELPKTGWLAWRLRNGFALCMPLVDLLLRVSRIEVLTREAVLWLEERRYVTTVRALLSTGLVIGAFIALVSGVVTRSVVGAVAVAALVVVLVGAGVGAAKDRRLDAVRDAVPDTLRSMQSCFEAGFTLLQTFHQVADGTRGPLRQAFRHAAYVLETGGSASDALTDVRQSACAADLAFVAVSLDVQHQAGGSIKQVLEAARDAVEGELTLRRSLKVQTAQARLSARVVGVMPFALIAVFSLVSKDFLAPFFESFAGYALLAVALGMQAGGMVLVRRVLATGVEG